MDEKPLIQNNNTNKYVAEEKYSPDHRARMKLVFYKTKEKKG